MLLGALPAPSFLRQPLCQRHSATLCATTCPFKWGRRRQVKARSAGQRHKYTMQLPTSFFPSPSILLRRTISATLQRPPCLLFSLSPLHHACVARLRHSRGEVQSVRRRLDTPSALVVVALAAAVQVSPMSTFSRYQGGHTLRNPVPRSLPSVTTPSAPLRGQSMCTCAVAAAPKSGAQPCW